MKISILAACLLLIAIYNLAIITYADFNQDYQKYLQVYDNYREQYNQYITTRSQYLAYSTLNSKSAALASLKQFLTARDDVLLSYIQLILLKQPSTDLADQLKTDIDFVNTHKNSILAINLLEDGVLVSRELENRHLELQTQSKKASGSVLIGRLHTSISELEKLEQEVNDMINAIKTKKKDTSTLERWSAEATAKRLAASEKLAQTVASLSEFSPSGVEYVNQDFSEIQTQIYETYQNLREATSFLFELKENIKYGNY